MISPVLRHVNSTVSFSSLVFVSKKRALLGERIWGKRDFARCRMTVSSRPWIEDACLKINGCDALTGVPDNVLVSPASNSSVFLGAVSKEKRSRHVFKLGVLQDYRLVCLFRFKIWWMIPRFGNSASDIPVETQMLLLEVEEKSAIEQENQSVANGSKFYILFLPVLDGEFRSSLQGNAANELEFCIESGDPELEISQSLESVFVNSGDNPFELMKESIMFLEKHKGGFMHRESKKMPENLDWFGWCTWDAFYSQVNPQGIREGLKSLSEGGAPPKFLIIDDGWQDTFNEFQKEGEPFIEGTQFASRLVSIKENKKFQGTGAQNSLRDFVTAIKESYGLKYVYVWHALMGYWGGVLPSSPEMQKYSPKLLYPVQSPGNIGNLRDVAMDSLEKYGVGTIDPGKIFEFFDDMHKYLASQNIDGVKVDVQNLIETLGGGLGGRVCLTRQCQHALEESVAKNFNHNNLICCMAHNTDSIYSLKKSAVTRASEDYMPRRPDSQTLHIASVAFNSILLGEFVVPDWDMFYSNHRTAEFHAVARALGGCGVYVSDKPGDHDFEILKKLVLPDGSVLRAKLPGRPTRDSLFNDPAMDGKSLLKIWNMNKLSGVLGIFNCQGAGVWPCLDCVQTNTDQEPLCLTGHVSPIDIEHLEEAAGHNWTRDCAVYAFSTGSLSRLPKTGSISISLEVLQCEIYTIAPIRDYDCKVQFSPIGLVNMYNSGGAIEAIDFVSDNLKCEVKIKGLGCGLFGAYSSTRPNFCTVNTKETAYEFEPKTGFLTLIIPTGIHYEDSFWSISLSF
ncbi:probable galactinol--sucrose galactosyltransferase 2 [Amborella trichopoda]|uniref:galactinol--sucrose galactosyltransferase n=1 Tax=Amborella trichopoda TaxID=13333 RepID=U5DFC2_AMBTC|nr:probable galactinol--sucrose galactosyltransferase 2 [Amborella trichopoda]ERN19108.1 hypothetical protein AMTR_s00061p00138520 [Amborella trichopoda]|eukprot:XP_006857641.3 probable galactinol--sucrose galactosyltransferase 2 [Amborella trichopoda]